MKKSNKRDVNKKLIRVRWTRIRYFLVCIFKLSGKNDRNEWLRKHNVFGMFGQESNFQPHYLPNNPKLIKIHNNVRIAADVTFYEHDGINYVFAKLGGSFDHGWRIHQSCIEIFDNCFIGGHSILIGDLRIGPNSIVAAGSVVTKDVKPGEIVAGNPAKVVGNFYELMEKRKIIDYQQEDYSKEEIIQQLWDSFNKKRKVMINL